LKKKKRRIRSAVITPSTSLRLAGHMPGLDGLRALAVIAVVWHHTHPGFGFAAISRNGFLGVDVFFVLSGFLITTLLCNEAARNGAVSLRNFYMRRTLRIFPLYYAVLGLLAIYFFATSGSNAAAFRDELPWHASYTSNWVHLRSLMAITWSLSTEEQFYLVWPPLLAWLGRRSIGWVLGFIALNQCVNFGLATAPLAALGLVYEELPLLQVTFTPILLGVLLAFALRVPKVAHAIESSPAWALPAACALALLLASVPGDLRGWPRLSFHLATAGVIAFVVMRPAAPIVRLLEARALVHIGAVSYGVYLLHMLVLHVASRGLEAASLTSPWLRFALVLAGTVALATLSHRFFEAPILRWKARFR
jgi:peptidoglycan/LPS O-acetylase OafA/YrhL